MTTSQGVPGTLRFASTFLSHVWGDKPLVEAVANQLGRRGVLTWLDKDELTLGPLESALKQAVQRQATMTIFISEAYLDSEYCRRELKWALEAQLGLDHVFPVYLGDPLKLVRSHPLLWSRFLDADGDRVNQLGYFHPPDPLHPDPEAIAEQIARAVYRRVIPRDWSDVAIVLDQRGDGPRLNPPPLPENVSRLDIPVLTFRPSREPAQRQDSLSGADWAHMAGRVKWALSTALGTLRGDPRKARVLGEAQTALVWAVGRHFDRTTLVDVYGHGRNEILTNKGQERLVPLPGGDPASAKTVSGTLSGSHPEIAIGVGSPSYATAAQKEIATGMPLLWLESGRITDSDQAMKLVKDLVASIERVRRDHDVRQVTLFWATANHIALLAAANLTSHVIPKLRFMEWHHHGAYEHLPMP